MIQQLPYCGTAPLPGQLLSRFNLDPLLIGALALICAWHLVALSRRRNAEPTSRVESRHCRTYALCGWAVAAAAFISPLCALSVSLFSARIAQHMVLILLAAPLIARALPGSPPLGAQAAGAPLRLWTAAAVFFVALWFWHMPAPYEATFTSTWVYWSMHLTLFGSGILLWRELLGHPAQHAAQALAAGALTFVHMGLLGAVLALADRPMFQWHLLTTLPWGLSPLQDQQLGGTLMWVPGIALFLWSALRSIGLLWESMERARPA
jgi:putative membrane protein